MEQRLKNRDQYIKTLDLRADIQKQIARKHRDYGKFPDAPEFQADEETEAERIEEFYRLRDLARERLSTVVRKRYLSDVEEALFKDDFETLKAFNRFWFQFKELLKGQTNLTEAEFVDVWNKFNDVLLSTDDTGIVVNTPGANVNTITYGPSVDAKEEQLIQDRADVLEDKTYAQINSIFNNTVKASDEILRNKWWYLYINPGVQKKKKAIWRINEGDPKDDTIQKIIHIIRSEFNLPNYSSRRVEDIFNKIDFKKSVGLPKYKTDNRPRGLLEFFDVLRTGGFGFKPEMLEERYLPIGKYVIHMEQLRGGSLNMKTPARAPIKSFPKRRVSTKFANILAKIVKNKGFSDSEYQALSKPEKSLLHKTITLSRLDKDEIPMLGGIIDSERDDLTDRFELLRGQLLAGNNNPNIVKEIKPLIVKLMDENLVSKEEGMKILTLLCTL